MLLRRWQRPEKQPKHGTAPTKAGSGTASTDSRLPLTVVRKVYLSEGARVYSLMTERTDTYYAGPALVHNCDSLQYACLHADNGASVGGYHTVAARKIVPRAYTYV